MAGSRDLFAIVYAKAFAAYDIKSFDQCEMLVGEGLALEPNNLDLLALGGQVKLQKQEYALARGGAQRMIELAPDDDRGFSLLAWATIQDDNYCPDNTVFDPDLDDGKAAFELRVKTAESLNERCLEIDPVDPRHWLLKSKIHLLRDQYDESIEAAETGLQFSPAHFGLHHYRILAFEHKGDIDSMHEALLQQLQRMPEDDTAHNKLSQIYLSKKEVDKAITHAREAVRIDPNDDDNKEGYWDAMMASNSFIRPFVYLRYAVRWLRRSPPWVHMAAMISMGIIGGVIFTTAQHLGEPWEGIVICSSIALLILITIIFSSDRPFMAVFDLYYYFRNPTFRVSTSGEKRNEYFLLVGGFVAMIVFLASLALQAALPIALMILAAPLASIYLAMTWKLRAFAIGMSILAIVLLWFGMSMFADSRIRTTERVVSVQLLIGFLVTCSATLVVTLVMNEKNK